jgi:hypothetical protein
MVPRPGAAGGELAASGRLADFRRTLNEETAMRQLLGEWIKINMVKDTDFGTIPGTPKPTLYKPGAEKLVALFKCTPVYRLEKTENFGNDGGKPFFAYEFRCRLELDSKKVLAEGYGSANSHESKYRYVYQTPKCPECGAETVRKGQKEKGGGFYCWRKIGGCGVVFKGEAERAITSQPLGKVDDPNVADKANTLLKMAKKRALVDAAIALARVSDMFTQDVEDHADEPGPQEPDFGGGPPGEEPPPPGDATSAPASRTAAAKERMKGKAAPNGNGAAAPPKDEGPLMEIGEREGPNAVRGKPIRTLEESVIRAHIGVGVDWLATDKAKDSPNLGKVKQCVEDLKAELLRRGLPAWEPKAAAPPAATPSPGKPPAAGAQPPAPKPEEPPPAGREPGDEQDEIPFGAA